MIKQDIKFDFDDLLIVPSASSEVNSRPKDVNVYNEEGMLPLFTAPMDTVIGMTNIDIFKENKIYPILPRTVSKQGNWSYYNFRDKKNTWVAEGLKEFEELSGFIEYSVKNLTSEEYNSEISRDRYILVDIANGNLNKLVKLVQKAKSIFGDKLHLMVGNVANPETYKLLSDAGADYVRVGVGNGGGCLTSQNVGVGYPLASLISECYEISCTLKNPAKIVADGGMKNYSDVIKALALGSDLVMIGSLFNRALESAGETFKANVKHIGVETWTEPGEPVDQYSENVKNAFLNGAKFYKKFRGMSTKSVQKLLGNETLKTSEGVTRMNPVEYTIEGWTENFSHYLASAMSYTGTKTLEEFIGKVDLVRITQHSFNRFNK
jgi:IMP dehydrogenase/GMP reductase